ncbi:MAG: hypothetical protein ACO1SX_04525 [Actinomycetota bacterium]
MYPRHSIAVGLVVATLGLAAGAVARPAAARRAAPDIRGSYIGNLRTTRGDLRQCDFVIASQNARWVGGVLNVAALPQGASMTGVLTGSDRITLNAQSSQGRRPVRIKLRARFEVQPELDRVVIIGSYVVTGGMREKGTFELVGSTHSGQE